LPTQIMNLLSIFCFPNLNVKDSNLFYQDLSGYILVIGKYSDERIGTIWVAFQF
jgi:branched-subunit amino acid transport protein AzlD